jgi:signal peptidase II
MKPRQVFLFVLLIILADQGLKIWVKTHMPLGHSIHLLGSKAQLYFVENEGMATGLQFGGSWGKLFLTLFRLAAVLFGVFYIQKIIKKNYHPHFIICAALIFAGALGNLIDSLFYGLIFEDSTTTHVARLFPAHGYTTFLHGKVVDMFYFPLIHTHFPNWLPFVGGHEFNFFEDIFNIADAAISVGVIYIILFQRKLFRRNAQPDTPDTASAPIS